METLRNDKRNGVVYSYVLDNIDLSGYMNTEGMNEKQTLQALFDIIKSEKKEEFERRGLRGAVQGYLEGLGGCLRVAFSDFDIKETCKSLGLPLDRVGRTDNIGTDWFYFLAGKIADMFMIAGIYRIF